MGQWKLMTGRDCDELRVAWVMTYVLPVDSWSLSHLGHLYPGTTSVMIKLDDKRSCPWV